MQIESETSSGKGWHTFLCSLFDFILKINSENLITLSALVEKTDSPESVLAMASFRKWSSRGNGLRESTQMCNQNGLYVTCRGCCGWWAYHPLERWEVFRVFSSQIWKNARDTSVVTSSLQPFSSMSQAWMDKINTVSWNVLGHFFPRGGQGPSLHCWLTNVHWTFASPVGVFISGTGWRLALLFLLESWHTFSDTAARHLEATGKAAHQRN